MEKLPEELLNETSFPISLTSAQKEKLYRLMALLKEANRKVNLTSLAEDQEVFIKHILDSLSVTMIWEQWFENVVDLGTGGGFPGLPLAVMYPETRFFLVDATQKKINFVMDAARSLGMGNVTGLAIRAEEMARDPAFREKNDLVVCRAVGHLSVLVELGAPLLKKGGILLAMKTKKMAEEIAEAKNAMQELGCRMDGVKSYFLPGLEERQLWRITKETNTSEKYPRRTGIPEKRPL